MTRVEDEQNLAIAISESDQKRSQLRAFIETALEINCQSNPEIRESEVLCRWLSAIEVKAIDEISNPFFRDLCQYAIVKIGGDMVQELLDEEEQC